MSVIPIRVPHILVVDNEPAICRALAMVLERAGFRSTTCTSGEVALEKLNAEHFDVLLVDLRMPDLRGDVLYHLATGIQPHLQRRTVFMTGDISERATELIAACNSPVLLKPFDLRDVTGAIAALLPKRARDVG